MSAWKMRFSNAAEKLGCVGKDLISDDGQLLATVRLARTSGRFPVEMRDGKNRYRFVFSSLVVATESCEQMFGMRN